MGGHGGLNILPQKKWNVYNHDNRAIVDKDKKQAQNKKRIQYQKERQSRLQGKIQVLKQENGQIQDPKDKKSQQFVSNLNNQFKKINQKCHINLFQNQQKIIENQQIFQIKRLKQAQFLKDKNMDYSSKFLGTYADANKKSPWYAREKGYVDQKRKPQQIQYLLSVKKSDSHTINQVVKIQKQAHQKHESFNRLRQRSRSRSRSREKPKNKQIKLQPKTQIQILRQKRLKREQKERQRALKLKRQKQYC